MSVVAKPVAQVASHAVQNHMADFIVVGNLGKQIQGEAIAIGRPQHHPKTETVGSRHKHDSFRLTSRCIRQVSSQIL